MAGYFLIRLDSDPIIQFRIVKAKVAFLGVGTMVTAGRQTLV